ncbi:MAG: serine O-acetyltransferase [Gemmatimonadales bacterium]
MMGLFSDIVTDLRLKARWSYGTDRGFGPMLRVLVTDGSMAIVCYRLMQWSRRYRLVPIEMVANRLGGMLCNCFIGRGAEFGRGFVLLHADGIVINRLVRGGDNIYIEHQVTIGADRGTSPVLGNDIFIGAGAKVLGPVTVGDGARIGANAVVVKDVPPYSTVVGVPARVVRQRQKGDEDTLAHLGAAEQFKLPAAPEA